VRTRHLHFGWVVVLVLLLLGCVVITGAWLFVRLTYESGLHKIKQNSITALYDTDPAALLAACDDIWQKRAQLPQDPTWNNTAPNDRTHPDPNSSAIPALVRSLSPSYITVNEKYVQLEFGGGGFHSGILAVHEPSPQPPVAVTKQLLPRLFYYSSDGTVPQKPTSGPTSAGAA
jgi:hypothetical protein